MVGTAITLAVCLKDIIELGRRIRSSVDKVRVMPQLHTFQAEDLVAW
jgi:hypothetical protein